MHKTDYDEIYLTDALGEVTWCEDRITDEDVKYVNAQQVKDLRAIVDRAITDLKPVLGLIDGDVEDYVVYMIERVAKNLGKALAVKDE